MTQHYELPIHQVPSTVNPVFRPWIEQFVNLSPNGIVDRLAEIWTSARVGVLGRLVDHILSFPPSSVVCHDHGVWLQMGQHAEDEFHGFFVAPQPAEACICEAFDRFHFSESVRPLMELFLRNFAGLCEEPPPSAGFFTQPPWHTLRDIEHWPDLEFGQFESAFPWFHCLCGDLLLVNSEGKTAWWVFDARQMVEFLDDVEQFVEFYLRFRASSSEERDGSPLCLDPYTAFRLLGQPLG
jgi:hypothetical protein